MIVIILYLCTSIAGISLESFLTKGMKASRNQKKRKEVPVDTTILMDYIEIVQ